MAKCHTHTKQTTKQALISTERLLQQWAEHARNTGDMLSMRLARCALLRFQNELDAREGDRDGTGERINGDV